MRGSVKRIRALLPEGGWLPDEVWARRHRAILILLYCHVVGIVIFGLAREYSLAHSAADASLVAVLTTLAANPRFSRKHRSALGALALVSASAVLVHLSGGSIEMHFHFFFALGVLSLYQDWLPFLLALGYVVVHHGLMGVLYPHSVYDHPSAWAHPWTWAIIHGVFVLATSVVLIISWRLNEIERARANAYERQIDEASLRRQQALEINDNIVQGLTVAKMALDLDQPDESRVVLAETLAKSRQIISALLGEIQEEAALQPGDLLRARPALLREN